MVINNLHRAKAYLVVAKKLFPNSFEVAESTKSAEMGRQESVAFRRIFAHAKFSRSNDCNCTPHSSGLFGMVASRRNDSRVLINVSSSRLILPSSSFSLCFITAFCCGMANVFALVRAKAHVMS
jgi:hypothetical protein